MTIKDIQEKTEEVKSVEVEKAEVEKAEVEEDDDQEEGKSGLEPSKSTGKPPKRKPRATAGAATRRRQRGKRMTSASMRFDWAECIFSCCMGGCIAIFAGRYLVGEAGWTRIAICSTTSSLRRTVAI